MCPFLLGCSICWPITIFSIILWFFVSLWYQFYLLLFHLLFYLDPLYFLMSLIKGLSTLFIFSNNQLLVSLIFSIFLLLFYIFPLWYLLFPSAVLFIIPLYDKLYFFTWGFLLVSWDRSVSLWTSLLGLLLLNPTDFRKLCFYFILSQAIFWFPLWFLHWPIVFLVAYCLASMCLCFSHFSYVIDV